MSIIWENAKFVNNIDVWPTNYLKIIHQYQLGYFFVKTVLVGINLFRFEQIKKS